MGSVIFVRNGETDWDRSGKLLGRADVELNETGIEQVRLIAERLNRIQINAIFASPLRRAVETAKLIGLSVSRGPVSGEGLLDFNYGDWEGKTPAELEKKDGRRYGEWLKHPDRVQIPCGESLKELRGRAFKFLVEHTSRLVEQPNVIVSHEMVGRILVCAVMDLPNDYVWRIPQDHAGITIFEPSGDGYHLRTLNDTAHLAWRQASERPNFVPNELE